MRLIGIGVLRKSCRTLHPHPEEPAQAGVSKDGRKEITLKCDNRAVKEEVIRTSSSRRIQRLAASLIRRLILAALALSNSDGCWPVAAHRQAQ